MLAKVRDSSKCMVPVAGKSVVETPIALILIDDFVPRPRVVVRRGGVGRERDAIEQRQRDGVHGASWNRVVGKLLTRVPHRRGRIVDILTEYARTLGERGHVRGDRAADA